MDLQKMQWNCILPKVLLNFFQKIFRVWGETQGLLLIKEYFKGVWGCFYDRKTPSTLPYLYNLKVVIKTVVVFLIKIKL